MKEQAALVSSGLGLVSWPLLAQAAPAVGIVLGALAVVVAFAVRGAIRGAYWDEEVGGRGSTVLVGMWLRQCFAWGMQPIVRAVLWFGLPAQALTILSLFLAVGAGAAISVGWMTLGGVLFVTSGVCDFFDGRIARHQGTAGPRGALLDSVIDRYVEAIVFAGLAWYFRNTWVLAVVLVAMAGSSLVPYVRARGESLGVPFKNVGIVQRPERIVILGGSLLTSSIVEVFLPHRVGGVSHRVIVIGLVLLALSTMASSLQRLVYASRFLRARDSEPSRPPADTGSLVRHASGGALATALDFAAVVAMVELAGLNPVIATALGCGLGALVNCTANRLWAFQRTPGSVARAGRYAFVACTSAGLNSGLLAILLLMPVGGYVMLWWLVRGSVYVLWNHPLYRDYVFHTESPATPADSETRVREGGDGSGPELASGSQPRVRGVGT